MDPGGNTNLTRNGSVVEDVPWVVRSSRPLSLRPMAYLPTVEDRTARAPEVYKERVTSGSVLPLFAQLPRETA
jgi:hypothetical protein